MNLLDVRKVATGRRYKTRIGRGTATGKGKRSTRGHRGQLGRSGVSFHPYFEGGQMPLARKLAKRGFNNKNFANRNFEINLSILGKYFDDGSVITPKELHDRGILNRDFDAIKILGKGELGKKFEIHAHSFSKKAKEVIEKAGGKAVVITPKDSARFIEISLGKINKNFQDGDKITVDSLVEKKLLQGSGTAFKIVSTGLLTKKLNFDLPRNVFARKAHEKIVKHISKLAASKK